MHFCFTNISKHVDHLKLILVLQHESTPKRPIALPTVLPGRHHKVPVAYL